MMTFPRQTLRTEVSGQRKQTILQTTSLVERRTVLLKRIQRFREIQRIHMPGFDSSNHRHSLPSAARNDTTPTAVEDVSLFLPSELNDHDRRRYCPAGLAGLENRLRYAEATDALEYLRHHLRTRSFTNRFKIANVTGQINNTRSRETQNRIDDKVRQSQIQYCRARTALLVLRGKGECSTLHSPTCPSGVRADCTDSLGLRADSAQTVWTPYDFGSPHKNYTMRELNQAPGTNSHLQGGVLYHCAIVACYTLPTCAIYVTCGLIGKCVYFYSI